MNETPSAAMPEPQVFDPDRRTWLHNWTDEDFRCQYAEPNYRPLAPDPRLSQEDNRAAADEHYRRNALKFVTVRAGEGIELVEWLGFHCRRHLVNREMLKKAEGDYGPMSILKRGAKMSEENVAAGTAYSLLYNADARSQMEAMTLRYIGAQEESPVMQSIRERIREEERAKLAAERGAPEGDVAVSRAAAETAPVPPAYAATAAAEEAKPKRRPKLPAA